MDVPVYRIDWGFEEGYGNVCRHEPRSIIPVDPDGGAVHVRFIPYGSTNLRLTELPFADLRNQ